MKRKGVILIGALVLALCSMAALASSRTETALFAVPHLYDWKVASGVQKAAEIPAVKEVSMNYDKGTARLVFHPDEISADKLAQAIQKVDPKARLVKVS